MKRFWNSILVVMLAIPLVMMPAVSAFGAETESTEQENVQETESVDKAVYMAEAGDDIATGFCGDNVTYELNKTTGVLTISGTGDMWEKDHYVDSDPWADSTVVYVPVNSGYAKEVIIEAGVTSISSNIFEYNSSISSVTIYGDLNSIGDGAFYSCQNLTSVTILGSVERIGDEAFRGCSHLASVALSEGLRNIGNYAFDSCYELKEITFPDGLISIGNDAFCSCSSMTSVSFPSNLIDMGEGVFDSCQFINEAHIKNIDFWLNMDWPLRSYPFSEVDFEYGECHLYLDDVELTDIVIPEDVTTIHSNAFSNCSNITSITIPESVNYIDDYAFYGCKSLEKINIEGNDIYIAPDAFDSAGQVTIYCPVKSDAVFYAKKYNIPYVTIPGWIRLAGKGRYDTMAEIVRTGFTKTGNTVVIATGNGFKDALAAAGLAGIYDAPVILTDGKKLSSQAEQQLKRLQPSRVFIAGGEAAISWSVAERIDQITGIWPERCYGQTSASTSADLAMKGMDSWSDTAIIVTNKTFKDALSAAPLSYSLHMPILLADNGKSLNTDVLDALNWCGITKVIIVGGELAVTKNVETQLMRNGIKNITRMAGKTAVDTSARIAEYGLSQGMTINGMGVATSQNYPDALAGAALCGHNNSVLVLADEKAMKNTSFPKKYKADFVTGYIFGGTAAVSDKVVNALQAAVE